MAHVEVNTALGSLHGTLGGHVFRKRGNKTIIQSRYQRTAPIGPGQSRTMRTFGDASQWFRVVVKADPVLHALYRKRGRERRKGRLNSRQMAIRDYFHPPEVDQLDFNHYDPAAGGRLLIHASDDFEVVRVVVTLRDADGAVFSTGDAQAVYGMWHYGAPALPAAGKLPAAAEVTAYDRPGNATTKSFLLVKTESPPAKPVPAAELIPGYV